MKIFKLGSTSSKPHRLPAATTQKMQNLLLKMNSQTKHHSSEMAYENEILACLQTKLGNLIDSTAVAKPVNEIYDGRASIETGKIRLEVNIKTGEIFNSKKPFTWKNAYKRVENLIDILQSNFDNPKVVEKKYLGLSGMTQKGLDSWNGVSPKIA